MLQGTSFFRNRMFNLWSSRDPEDTAIPCPKSQMRSPYSPKYSDSLIKIDQCFIGKDIKSRQSGKMTQDYRDT